MKQKDQEKQNTKKELKETLNWTSPAETMAPDGPVTLDPQIAVALAAVIAPTPCSDAPPVHPVLKAWLLHA